MSHRTIQFFKHVPHAVAAAMILSGASGAALAQSAPATGDVAQWVKQCNPQQPDICNISKDYVSANLPGPLATFIVQTTADPKKFQIGLQVPLGFVFPPGIPISVDGEKKATGQYVICLPPPQGQSVLCLAQAPVTDDFIAALKKGSKLELTLTDGSNKAVPLNFSLAGFSKSFDGPDQGEAALAKQRAENAQLFQKMMDQKKQELIDAQRKQK